MKRLKYALLGALLLAGCEASLNTFKSSDDKDITGTYEQWIWSYGPEGPDNDYLKSKAIFSERHLYEYKTVTVRYTEYEYNGDDMIRFKIYNTEYWAGWKEIRWYGDDTFCIINQDCYKKVEEYSGPE